MAVLDVFRVQNLTSRQRRTMVTVVAHLARGALPALARPRELSIRPAGAAASENRRVQWMPMGPRFPDNSYRTIVCNFIVTVAAGAENDPVYDFFGETLWELHDEATAEQNLPGHNAHPEVGEAFWGQNRCDIGFQIDGGQAWFGGQDRNWSAMMTEFEPDFHAAINQKQHYAGAVNVKWGAQGRIRPPGGGAAPNRNPSFLCKWEMEIPDDLPMVFFNTWVANSEVRDDNDIQREDSIYHLTDPIRFYVEGRDMGCTFREEEFWFPRLPPTPTYMAGRKSVSSRGDDTRTEYLYIDVRGDDGNPAEYRRRFPFAFQTWRQGVLTFKPRNQLETDSIMAEAESPLGAVSQGARLRNEFGAGKHVYIVQGGSETGSNGGLETAARHTANDDYNTYLAPVRKGDHYTASRHGNWLGAGQSGPHPDFGTIKGLHHVNGFSADFRALRVGQMLNFQRSHFNYMPDGSRADYWSAMFRDPSRPWLTSTYLPYSMHTFYKNDGGIRDAYPDFAHGLGVRRIADRGPTNYTAKGAGNGVNMPFQRSHFGSNYLTTYTLLTGDTFCRRWLIPMLQDIVLAILERSLAERDRFYQDHPVDNHMGTGQLRGYARMHWALLNWYSVLGNQRNLNTVAMRCDEHMRRQMEFRLPRSAAKPVKIFYLDPISQGVAPMRNANGSLDSRGVNCVHHPLMAFALHSAVLWLAEDNNPRPDPYWDQGGLVDDPPVEEALGT